MTAIEAKDFTLTPSAYRRWLRDQCATPLYSEIRAKRDAFNVAAKAKRAADLSDPDWAEAKS